MRCAVGGLAVGLACWALTPAALAERATLAVFRPSSSIADALATGDILVALGRHSDALDVFENLVATHPELVDAWIGRARALRASGDHAAAEAALREALAKWPGDGCLRATLGDLCAAQGRFAEAEAIAGIASTPAVPAEAAACAPFGASATERGTARFDAAGADVVIGNVLWTAGELDAGRVRLRAALDRDPSDWVAAYWLGALEVAARRYAAAESVLEAARRRAPDRTELRTALALALRLQNRFSEAEAVVREVLAQEPDLAEANFELACIYADQDVNDRALGPAQRAVELLPDWAEAWYWLGYNRLRTGDADGAERAFTAASKLGYESAFMVADLANVRALQRRFDEADVLFRRAHDADPDNSRILENYAWFLLDRGRHGEAEKALRAAAATEGPTAALRGHRWLSLAMFYAMTGQPQAGRRAVIDALAEKVDPPILAWAGHALLALGDLDRAELVLREALAQNADDSLACDLLARVLHKQGRDADVAELLKRRLAVLLDRQETSAAELVDLAQLHAIAEEPAVALRLVDQAQAAGFGSNGQELYTIACTLALAGEAERTREALQQALDRGYLDLPWIRFDPDLESVRAAPWFDELLARYVTAWPLTAAPLE